ncbi:MAG: hypothetical protein SGPRY_011724, partial [Prymnesium sp.]
MLLSAIAPVLRSAAWIVVPSAAALFALRWRASRSLALKPPAPRGQPLVVVVGLGGVGSHAAQLLLRGGARRLRLVDFDQVTLSSLNRHATATRRDVGTSKAVALRDQLLRVDPEAEVEACTQLFSAEFAESLLAGSPALVIDAIDDLTTKAELLQACKHFLLTTNAHSAMLAQQSSVQEGFLLQPSPTGSAITHCSISTAGGSLLKLTNANPQYCVRSGLRVLSALGAGGKANAAELHVARLAEVYNDPIGTALLKRFKADKSGKLGIRRSKGQSKACAVAEERQISMSSEPLEPHEDSLRNPTDRAGARDDSWWLEIANQVWVVYSSELQQVSLLPLPQGVDARELGSQPSFRVRVMPVMPPLPAAFGAALAGAGISMLLESPPSPPPRPMPTLTISFARKLYQRFLKHELSDRKSAPGSIQLSIDDVVTVVCDIFRCRCALTGARLHDPGRRNFMLCRWDLARDASVEN